MPALVADKLREQIVSGAYPDGHRLAKEEILRQEFGVGRPAMREAMRILESEGLITVLRGNQGGALVRSPQPAQTAYSLGLVLVSRGVDTTDVGRALRELEPACAGLCAARSDRQHSVLPRLAKLQRESEAQLDDASAASATFRQFHEAIVAQCGNQTLAVVAGALEALWTCHVATATALAPRPRSTSELKRSHDEHGRILEMIEAGDVDGARDALMAHIVRVQQLPTAANRPTPLSTDTIGRALRT
jgi:DNA-binding FadR family transcriptional regulator